MSPASRLRSLALLAGTASAVLATSLVGPGPAMATPPALPLDGPSDAQPAPPPTGPKRTAALTPEEGMALMSGVRPESSYDQFLVHVADPTMAAEKITAAADAVGVQAAVVRNLATGAAVVHSDNLDAAKAWAFMSALAADPDVRHVTPDMVVRTSDGPDQPGQASEPPGVRAAGAGTEPGEPPSGPITGRPDDPLYPAQWHFFERRAGINLPKARKLSTGAGVTVAVIDTGIIEHPDLDANVVPGYDFITDPAIAQDGDGRDDSSADPGDFVPAGECGSTEAFPSSWHGSHTGGLIAAVAGNGRFVASVAPEATVQPVRVLGRCGGRVSDLVDAIVWSSGGTVPGTPDNPTPAQVLNLSLGGPSPTCPPALQEAIDSATGRGSTIVVAAGNEDSDARMTAPANCNSVVTVGALDRQGNRAFYSNFGPAVDLTGPGGESQPRVVDGVLSTVDAGRTTPVKPAAAFYSGTSEATPHVAGVVALIQARRIGGTPLTPAEVEQALKNSARQVPGTCPGGCGAGLVDAFAAVSETLPTQGR